MVQEKEKKHHNFVLLCTVCSSRVSIDKPIFALSFFFKGSSKRAIRVRIVCSFLRVVSLKELLRFRRGIGRPTCSRSICAWWALTPSVVMLESNNATIITRYRERLLSKQGRYCECTAAEQDGEAAAIWWWRAASPPRRKVETAAPPFSVQ